MKPLLVCVLLALVPLSGLRIVCVAAPASAASSAAAQKDAAAADECERVCRRHPAATQAPAPASRAVMTCLLVPDPTCELIAGDAPAVLPVTPALPRADGAARVGRSSVARYVSHAPPLSSPPPRLLL